MPCRQKIPRSRKNSSHYCNLENAIQYFLDGFPMVINLPSLALEVILAKGFLFAAHLPSLDKKNVLLKQHILL